MRQDSAGGGFCADQGAANSSLIKADLTKVPDEPNIADAPANRDAAGRLTWLDPPSRTNTNIQR
jgi:hypothetical protein